MGNKNGRALSTLQEEVQKTQVDAVLHVGDLAYDLADVRSFLLAYLAFHLLIVLCRVEFLSVIFNGDNINNLKMKKMKIAYNSKRMI